MDFYFEYLNTASSKIIYQLIRSLAEISLEPKEVLFTWYYDPGDFDLRDMGHELLDGLECPFQIVEKSEME
ncbi:MAG: DUF1987 domain-containing protein [Bacteroidales bacterium]|nr:DUF1987 domain-containing protein [Bacteroidales bacterium]